MSESAQLDQLLAKAATLASQYQSAIDVETHNKSMASSMNEYVIAARAKQVLEKDNSVSHGKSFFAHATQELLQTELLQGALRDKFSLASDTANRLAITIQRNVLRTNALIRSAERWEDMDDRDVNSERIRQEARENHNALSKQVISDLQMVTLIPTPKDRVEPDVGEEIHTYKTIYHERQPEGEASDLEHEPEELMHTLDYIQGHGPRATIGDIIDYEGAQGKTIKPDVLTYLAHVSHEHGKGRMQTLTVPEVEQAVLADAPEAHLSVTVVKQITQPVKKQFDHKAYQKTLVTAAYELANAHDKLPVEKMPIVSDSVKLLHSQMVANQQPGNRVTDLRKYVHHEAEKEGITKAIDRVEALAKQQQADFEKKTTPKKKAASMDAAVDGGRKIGESRPGAGRLR